jgi:hypothetical protein
MMGAGTTPVTGTEIAAVLNMTTAGTATGIVTVTVSAIVTMTATMTATTTATSGTRAVDPYSTAHRSLYGLRTRKQLP